MTDLEERVRDALQARAERFTASQDAWERTRARAGDRAIRRQAYRPARRRWLTRFTPLAAAAAVLVIGAGTAIVAGTGAFGGRPAPQATPTATATPSSSSGRGGSPGMDCAFPGLPEKIPVTGVQISAKVTVNGVTTWWTRIPENKYPQSHANLALCQTHGGGASSGPEGPLRQGQLVRVDNASHGGLNDGNAANGIAAASVTSMEADLANGSVVHGSVAYGQGFPYAAWWLVYPEGIAATLVFRDAAGRAVATVAEPYPPASALKHPVPLPPTTYPGVGAYGGVCQQARVQQVMDGIKVWTYVGFTYPEPVQANNAKPTLCEVTGLVGAEADYVGVYTNAGQVARRIFVLNPTQSVSGVAVRSVTSVTAVLAGGKQYTGTIVTNKLFTYPVWIVSYPLKDPATLVFRNAAGKEVAVLHEPANP
jgi:hypothetical protein